MDTLLRTGVPVLIGVGTSYFLCTVDPVPERKPFHYAAGAAVAFISYRMNVYRRILNLGR